MILTILLNILSYYKSLDLNKQSFTLQSLKLIDQEIFNVKKDKPLLVYVWATWCPICKIESNHIQTLSNYFEVLTIAVDSGSDEDLKKYLMENNFNFKVYNDKNRAISSQMNIKGYPTIFIYDKQKQLQFTDVGYTSTFSLYLKMLWAGL